MKISWSNWGGNQQTTKRQKPNKNHPPNTTTQNRKTEQQKRPGNHMLGPILEASILTNCTPLWREAHLQVKMHKTPHSQTIFEVPIWKKHAAVAQSTFASQNVSPLFEAQISKKLVSQ